jgi:hypothetical protein
MADNSNPIDRLDHGDRRGLVRYWHLCGADERVDVLRRVLKHPALWRKAEALPMLSHVGPQLPSQWPELALAVLEAFRAAPLEDAAEACAIAITTAPAEAPDELLRQLVEAFAEQAGPSEARSALRMIASSQADIDHTNRADRLITWLIERCGAEARRTADPLVAWCLQRALVVGLLRDRSLLQPLLRIIAGSESPVSVLLVNGAGDGVVWPACERALEDGAPDELIADLFASVLPAMGPLGSDRFLAPLRQGSRMRPAAFAALLRTAASGNAIDYLWQEALKYAPPAGQVMPISAMRSAVRAIATQTDHPTEHAAAWGELIANSWFHAFGVTQSDEQVPGVWQLDALASHPDFAPGIERALRLALDREPAHRHAEARPWMADARRDPRIASLVLLLLDRPEVHQASCPLSYSKRSRRSRPPTGTEGRMRCSSKGSSQASIASSLAIRSTLRLSSMCIAPTMVAS